VGNGFALYCDSIAGRNDRHIPPASVFIPEGQIMNPYRRSARFLMRIIAITLIFSGATLFYVDAAKRKIARIKPPPAGSAAARADAAEGWVKRIVSRSLPWVLVIVGVPLLVRSSALARRLTEDLEDDEEPTSET
jgi:hypothetical protein